MEHMSGCTGGELAVIGAMVAVLVSVVIMTSTWSDGTLSGLRICGRAGGI